jgi:hypothetical protein
VLQGPTRLRRRGRQKAATGYPRYDVPGTMGPGTLLLYKLTYTVAINPKRQFQPDPKTDNACVGAGTPFLYCELYLPVFVPSYVVM